MSCNKLLFPVIAWYDIISKEHTDIDNMLLFPVIAWYDIIIAPLDLLPYPLLFPVIAWYDIITYTEDDSDIGCCSRLSLGMI